MPTQRRSFGPGFGFLLGLNTVLFLGLQGNLAAVDPPVRFGFGSTPRFPALARVTTTVEMPPR